MSFDPPMSTRPLIWLDASASAMALALLLTGGCGGGGSDGASDGGLDSGPPEVDGGTIPPGAIPCETVAECDDGASCTADSCNDRGFCENLRQNPMCSDGVFCNGAELCDPEAGTADERGCIAGPPRTCSDNDVCTTDRCDEENDVCISDPRDFDLDGDPDWFCEGGDCDDRDPFVNGSINELCGDGKDNDCDGEVDENSEDDPCGAVPHDVCSDALDVSAGGTFVINARGAAGDYGGSFSEPIGFSCSTSARPDVALVFTIDQARDVSIRANGDSTTAISLHRAAIDPETDPERVEEDCTTTDNEVECFVSFRDPLRIRGLEPGTYYVLVQDFSFRGGTEDLAVTVEIDEATPPPTNETCAAPIDISAGGVFSGDFVDVTDDISRLGCSFGNRDLAYVFTIDEPRNVSIRAASPSGESTAFEVRSACDDASSALRCAVGVPATGTLFELAAGTYFVVLESSRETDFDLDIRFDEPTPPPPGEDCESPIDLAVDTVVDGSITSRTDEIRVACASLSSFRDVVYEFELAEEKDVTVVVEGATTYWTEIRSSCDDVDTSLLCRSGRPSILRRRNLPAGTYTLIVETFVASGDFTVEVRTSDPATPTEVSDNDVCVDAHPVPETGGVFTGSTILLENQFETASFCGNRSRNQDATFELELTATKRVVASTFGSGFDTTLHVHRGAASAVCVDPGGDGIFDTGPLTCNDDVIAGTSASLVDVTLGPSTYYLVVDGAGDGTVSESGTYELDILVLDP